MADEWTIDVRGDKVVKMPADVPVGQILKVKRGDQTTVYERVIEPVEPGSEKTRHVWREVDAGSLEGDDADQEQP